MGAKEAVRCVQCGRKTPATRWLVSFALPERGGYLCEDCMKKLVRRHTQPVEKS